MNSWEFEREMEGGGRREDSSNVRRILVERSGELPKRMLTDAVIATSCGEPKAARRAAEALNALSVSQLRFNELGALSELHAD